MRRHRRLVVWLSVLALVWCQISAAAGWCGPLLADLAEDSPARVGAGACHGMVSDGLADSESGRSCHCQTGSLLSDASGLHFDLALLPPLHYPLIRRLVADSIAVAQAAHPGTGPPAHFLPRLLI